MTNLKIKDHCPINVCFEEDRRGGNREHHTQLDMPGISPVIWF